MPFLYFFLASVKGGKLACKSWFLIHRLFRFRLKPVPEVEELFVSKGSWGLLAQESKKQPIWLSPSLPSGDRDNK